MGLSKSDSTIYKISDEIPVDLNKVTESSQQIFTIHLTAYNCVTSKEQKKTFERQRNTTW